MHLPLRPSQPKPRTRSRSASSVHSQAVFPSTALVAAIRPISPCSLRNADPKAKYEYELVVLDDECKPNVAVQVATKMAADKDIIAGATHYCSATAIATVDTYHKFGFPVIVWGAVLPDITYPQQVRRGAPRQRDHDQPERRQRRADLQARLQDCRGHSRHHRLRQRVTTNISARRSPSSARPISSARSASLPTSRTSPPSSPRSRRSIRGDLFRRT